MQSQLTPSKTTNYATLTPEKFFRDINRLSEYPSILVLFVASIIITLFLSPYIWARELSFFAVVSNLLNLGIYGVGVWGGYVALIAIARMEIEIATASTIVSRIREETDTSVLELDKLPEKFVPQNATVPALTTRRLFEHICREARNMRYDSALNVIQPFYEECSESLLEVMSLQKLALRSGIFATFLGLLLALKELPNWSTLDITELLGRFGGVLLISFSGSVVGLQVAIVLGVLLLMLRKKQNLYYQKLVETAEWSLDTVRDAKKDNSDVIISELSDVRKSIADLMDRLYDHGERIAGVITGTTVSIRSQSEVIAEGIEALKQSKVSYQDLLNEVSGAQRQFIEEIREAYKNLSLDRFRREMKDGIVEAGSLIADTLKSTESSIEEQSAVIVNTSTDFVTATSNLSAFLEQINASQEKFIQNIEKAQDLSPILSSSKELKQSLGQLQEDINRLTHAVRILDTSVNTSVWSRVFGMKRKG
jgi:hypothetical protein